MLQSEKKAHYISSCIVGVKPYEFTAKYIILINSVTVNRTCCKQENRNGPMVVKWSACSPSIPRIRVRIPLSLQFLFCKICFQRTKMNKKGPGMVHLKKDDRPLTLQTDKKIQLPFFQDSYEICLATAFGSLTGSFLSLNLSAGLIGPSRFTPYRS